MSYSLQVSEIKDKKLESGTISDGIKQKCMWTKKVLINITLWTHLLRCTDNSGSYFSLIVRSFMLIVLLM